MNFVMKVGADCAPKQKSRALLVSNYRENTRARHSLGLGIVAFALCSLSALGAQAATYTVTTTGDATGSCTASGTNFTCDTLRAALDAARRTTAADTINFNITTAANGTGANAGGFVISPATALPSSVNPATTPAVAGTLTIDGTTQPGFSTSNPNQVPLIVLMGPGTPATPGTFNGLQFGSTASSQNNAGIVRALAIQGFSNGLLFTTPSGSASSNTVTGCYIGVARDGSAVGNGSGIVVEQKAGVTIGGTATTPGVSPGNIISGNTVAGIVFGSGTGATGIVQATSTVQGNLIGRNLSGVAVPNGIGINSTSQTPLAQPIIIGGTTAGQANVIASNTNEGVRVSSANLVTTSIRANRIFSNGGLGINLVPTTETTANTVTPNDANDPDTGPNTLQNFPVLTSAAESTDGNGAPISINIQGTLNSTPSTGFTIDFFRSVTADPSGNGEGEVYLGSSSVTTDSGGNATINATISGNPAGGLNITATATTSAATPGPVTSEFSNFVTVTQTVVSTDRNSLIVNSTDDSDIGGDGKITLREAILAANTGTGSGTISFNIPFAQAANNVFTITVNSALPVITRSGAVIDGRTQTTFDSNANGTADDDTNPNGPEVVISGGASLAAGTPGLIHQGGGGAIRSVVINGFKSDGLRIALPVSGGAGVPNASGTGTVVTGCYFGLDGTGTTAVPNGGNGILVTANDCLIGDAGTNTLSGVSFPNRNVSSGNTSAGVRIRGSLASNNRVRNNYLGPNANGALVTNAGVFGNSNGMTIDGASNNTIGGDTFGNLIGGNNAADLAVTNNATVNDSTEGTFNSLTASNNVIQGNYIGSNPAGTAAIGSNQSGINSSAGITGGAISNNTIGGGSIPPSTLGGSGVGNLIIGHTTSTGNGSGINFNGTGTTLSTGWTVQGNYIGVTLSGAVVANTRGITIGGLSTPAGSGLVRNTIIGLAANGTGLANIIAGNTSEGVRIQSTTAPNNSFGISVRGNSIFNNGGLGINLVGGTETNSVTPNDPVANKDADVGPNNLQNFPVITDAFLPAGGGTIPTVNGTLNSAASKNYLLDFYASDNADSSGFGEGQNYLGSVTVATDASGNATFSFTPTTNSDLTGKFISVTATDNDVTTPGSAVPTGTAVGDTSEFSRSVQATLRPTVSIGAAPATVEGNSGTGAAGTGTNFLVFPLTLSNASGATTTVTYSTSDGSATAGSDYIAAVNATATIAAGQTTGSISVPILGDTVFEPNETLNVTLSAATNATLGTTATASGQITNDDNAPTLSVSDANGTESATGTPSLNFTVSLSSPSASGFTVDYVTTGGTATAGSDYTTTNGTLTFNAGDTTKTVAVPILDDTIAEGPETLTLTISNASGGIGIARATATGTIVDDEQAGTAATPVTGVSVLRSGLRRNRGTGRFVQTLVLQNDSGAAITGPVYLVLDNLPAGVTAFNPTGTTTNTQPTGSPYFVINNGADLPTGGTTINVEFVNPNNASISFTERVLKGPGTP